MKKFICIAGLFSALLAVACEKKSTEADFPLSEPQMVPASVTASIGETRVCLDGVSPKWTSGDQIAVFTTSGTKCPAFSTSDSGSTASFSGTKPDGSVLGFAIYPYSSAVSVASGSYTVTVPSEQDGSLGNAVMAARADGEALAFQNLCSVVKLSIPASLSVRKVEIIGENALSGNFTVNGSTLAVTAPSSPSDAAKRVSVSSSSNLSGDVLVCVIPSGSKKMQLVLTNAGGKCALVSKDMSTALTAGHIKNLGTVPTTLTFSEVALIGSSTSSQSSVTATQPSKPQVTNGDFETWTLDGDNLPNNWNSFQTFQNGGSGLAKIALAQGYSSSDRQVQKSTDKRPGTSGSYSCRIWARSIAGLATAQGNLTTGRIYASNTKATGTGNYNYTDQDGSMTINSKSNPFHMDFTGRPDTMSIWVKFIPAGTDSNHPYAKVEAILHDKVDYKSGYNSSDCTGGTHHIGEASKSTLSSTGSSWTNLRLPFVYDYSTTPSFILISLATNAYPGGGTANDEMYIDDIEMIYNLYNLKTDSNGWATLYLGYDALIPSGATAYIVTDVKCGYASLTAISSGKVLPKNTAVLVKGSASTVYAFNGQASDVSGKTKASVSGNLLKGTLTSISRPSGTCRVLSSGESTGSMAAFGAFTGSTVAANTAYLAQ